MAGGVTLGKFCIVALIVISSPLFLSAQQAPVKIRCADNLCKGPVGSGEASQDYVADAKDKLSLKQGAKLTILGVNDQFFFARVGDDEPGLVAKHFIKQKDITTEPQIDVDLSSLIKPPPAAPDPEKVKPTQSVGCIVDGTSVSDPELCPQMPSSVDSSDMKNNEAAATSTVPTPILPEDSVTESYMAYISKTVLTTLASAIEPSGGAREVVKSTEAASQEKIGGSEQTSGKDVPAKEAAQEIPRQEESGVAQIAEEEVVTEVPPAGATMSQTAQDSLAVGTEPGRGGNFSSEVQPSGSAREKLEEERDRAVETEKAGSDLLADSQQAQISDSGSSRTMPDVQSSDRQPPESTEAPPVEELLQGGNTEPTSQPEDPHERADTDNIAKVDKGAASPSPDPPNEHGTDTPTEPMIGLPGEILSPSSALPQADGSSASQTNKLPEPKVTHGRAAPKDLPPPVRIRPTTVGHSHFHTRDAHGHSHGNAHSHDHGHGHSHNHGNVELPTIPEEQVAQSHSYPGEKPESAVTETAPVPAVTEEISSRADDEAPTPQTQAVEPAPLQQSVTPEKKEPDQYKINTVEQICERNDGVGCGGEPVSKPAGEARPQTSKYRPDDSAIREYVGLVLSMIPEPAHGWLSDLEGNGVSSHVVVLTFLCGILASFLVVFFSCITQTSKESALQDYIARLEQQIFSLKKEREVLLEGSEQTTQVPDDIMERHEEEVTALQARTSYAERELGLAKDSIEKYQEALSKAQEAVAEMELEYQKKRDELELKQEETMEEMNELRIERANFDQAVEEKELLISELRDTNAQLLKEAQIWDERWRELTAKLEEVTLERVKSSEQLNAREAEVESLKASLKVLSVLEKARDVADETEDEDEVIARLLDVQVISTENETLKEKNSALEVETAEAKAQLEKWRVEVESLKNDIKQALKQKQDSEQKLQVLSDYFKDKELTLQRDVVKQETLRQQKENDALGINEQLDLYREQNITLQSQMTAVKEELEISERRFKRQLMEHEKKAHDNWMAFKNATKTVEELQGELQILRQQLIQFQKEREASERTVNLPQDRPRPPPPLPLPKGVAMNLPPMPLPNLYKDLPSPPMARYIEGARRTPPVGVPLPSVLYQPKTQSSRHSSDHSVRSGGSRGGIMSPDLRRNTNHRRSDRADRSKDSNQ